jgi:hypothetical protein
MMARLSPAPRVREFLTAAALLITAARAAAAPPPRPPELGGDPRLEQRVSLRADRVPVGVVLAQLSAETGVRMSAVGRPADERLIAFVPESPLAEVMGSIAELYRLRWSRTTGVRPIYRLQKPPSTVREEQARREEALTAAFEALTRELEAADAKPGEGPPALLRQQARLRQFGLQHVRRHWGRLLEEGYVGLPLVSLPRPEREPLFADLAPWMAAEFERFRAQGAEYAAVSPPAPEQGVLEAHASFHQALHLEVVIAYTLKAEGATWEQFLTLFEAGIPQPDVGRAPYRQPGRTLRPAEAGDEGTIVPPRDDPFQAPVRPVGAGGAPRRLSQFWRVELERLSENAGLAIYSDDYLSPRFFLPTEAPRPGCTAAEMLDFLCAPSRALPQMTRGGFWWRRGDSALVRTGSWLWDQERVVSTAVLRALAAAAEGERALAVPVLTTLSPMQYHGLFIHYRIGAAWREGVLVPAQLSPAAWKLLTESELRPDDLLPPDRALLLKLLPEVARREPPGYLARLGLGTTWMEEDGGRRRALTMSLEVYLGHTTTRTSTRLPLPDGDPSALVVRKVPSIPQVPRE